MEHRGYSAIGLYEPKFDSNVGGVLRAAMCYNADLVVIQGRKYKQEATDTTKAARHIPVQMAENIMYNRPVHCETVAVEIVENSIWLPHFIHPDSAYYIFGPEDGSLPDEVIKNADYVVKIPTEFCMNLASTVNVVLYDRVAKARFRTRGSW